MLQSPSWDQDDNWPAGHFLPPPSQPVMSNLAARKRARDAFVHRLFGPSLAQNGQSGMHKAPAHAQPVTGEQAKPPSASETRAPAGNGCLAQPGTNNKTRSMPPKDSSSSSGGRSRGSHAEPLEESQ
jgi:hypothetical protein